MLAGALNITIDQGADWVAYLTCVDSTETLSDLTGYINASALIGKEYGDVNAITVVADFVDENDNIVSVGTDTGVIRVFIDDAISSAITWSSGVYEINVEEPSGNKVRLLRGSLTIRPQVQGA